MIENVTNTDILQALFSVSWLYFTEISWENKPSKIKRFHNCRWVFLMLILIVAVNSEMTVCPRFSFRVNLCYDSFSILAQVQVAHAFCNFIDFCHQINAKWMQWIIMAGALINPTLLGYPDEEILDKHFSQIDFTTSKIGGLPVSEIISFFQKVISKETLEY